MFGKKPVTEDHLEHNQEVSTSHAAVVNAKPTLLNYTAAIFACVPLNSRSVVQRSGKEIELTDQGYWNIPLRLRFRDHCLGYFCRIRSIPNNLWPRRVR
jgi:hypothetical protein